VVAQKDHGNNDNFIKIYANNDQRMKELGQILKTPKSLKIWQILQEKELHTKEIGMILENEPNPRLPNLTHHLKKMINVELLTSTKKMKNGHALTYYKAIKYVMIVPSDKAEIANKSKTLKSTLRKVFKISAIMTPSVASYFLIKFLENMPIEGTKHVSSQFTYFEFLVPIGILGGSIGIERMLNFFNKRHSMNIERSLNN